MTVCGAFLSRRFERLFGEEDLYPPETHAIAAVGGETGQRFPPFAELARVVPCTSAGQLDLSRKGTVGPDLGQVFGDEFQKSLLVAVPPRIQAVKDLERFESVHRRRPAMTIDKSRVARIAPHLACGEHPL